MAKIGINGFGRIGRLTFRAIKEYHSETISAVAANGSSDAKTNAHLIKWDSVYRKYHGQIEAFEDFVFVDGEKVDFYSTRDPHMIPWGELDVDIVIDCTGTLKNSEQIKGHLENGAKRVIVSAPSTMADITIIQGINETTYDPAKHRIISGASCTSNCIIPVAKVLHDDFGINKGFFTTIHAYTGDQQLLDRAHDSLRRSRSAAVNIIPTTTGAAKTIGQIIPDLEGKIDGMAIRVPVPAGSLVDFVVELNNNAFAEAVNESFRRASKGSLKGILDYSDEELVSSDYIGSTASSIIDARSTEVLGDNLVKVLAWFDNEWGYCCRMADLASYIAQQDEIYGANRPDKAVEYVFPFPQVA